jgi:hypothetical protein
MPVLGLAHHTLGVLFHYLYLGLPGMALAVGALAEWSAHRQVVIPRLAVGGALLTYVAVSVATLWVVLAHVDRTGAYPGLGKPLGLNMAAAEAARAALRLRNRDSALQPWVHHPVTAVRRLCPDSDRRSGDLPAQQRAHAGCSGTG